MSLTRFLPTPSDRMGIIWSLLPIEDTVVLEYGPAGTTHFSMGLFMDLGEIQQNHLFTTHMSENDVIMGDVTRLENAIVEIDRTLSPKVIFVVASSVAAVIGTDIRGVCTYMQERVKARLITFETGGFRGDYSVGLTETYKMLVRELILPHDSEVLPETNPDTYNLIGFSMGSYRAASDLNEIKDLLSRAFGLKLGANLCGETSVTAIENAGSAGLNLVLREEGIPAASLLRERYGTPTVAGAPYGYRGTLEWLEKISEAIGRPVNPALRMEIAGRLRQSGVYPMYARTLTTDRPHTVLCGEYRTVLGIGQFLTDIGLKPDFSVSLHSLKSIPNPDPSVTFCKTEKERLEMFESLHRTLILADEPTMSVCPRDNVFLRISMPIINGAQIAKHLPLMGLRGADMILEAVESYYQLVQ